MTRYEMMKYNIWLRSESYRCHERDKQEASLLNRKVKFPGYFGLSLHRPVHQFSPNPITMELTRCSDKLAETADYYNITKIRPHNC